MFRFISQMSPDFRRLLVYSAYRLGLPRSRRSTQTGQARSHGHCGYTRGGMGRIDTYFPAFRRDRVGHLHSRLVRQCHLFGAGVLPSPGNMKVYYAPANGVQYMASCPSRVFSRNHQIFNPAST